ASAHGLGRKARQALEDARERIASLLDAAPDEAIFTSGATEANNLAIFNLAGEAPAHIIVSPIEHPSVVEPVRQLAERGFVLDELPVDSIGLVSSAALTSRIQIESRLVAIQLANHETGVVQPIRDLAACGVSAKFHCDATQAVGKMPVHFHE